MANRLKGEIMTTISVNKETLQKLLDYIEPNESKDFEECIASEWSEAELEHHAFNLIRELQDSINSQ
jgi:hypothetical protein